LYSGSGKRHPGELVCVFDDCSYFGL